MSCGVEGVILHEDVILNSYSSPPPPPPQGQGEAVSTLPVVDWVLRRLRYSGIRTGIALRSGSDSPAGKVDFVRNLAASYAFSCFGLNSLSVEDVTRVIQKSWGEDGGEKVLYVIPGDKEELGIELATCGWVVVVLISGLPSCNQSVNSDIIYIHSLNQLPSIICGSIKKTASNDILRVGYIMKPSREEDFAKRGAFPMRPTPTRLVFMPLTFELPLSPQLEEVDLVLHKATDEIISANLNMSSEASARINYSKGMQEVKSYLGHHKQVCVIDPFDKVYPIVDRLEIQQILSNLKDLDSEGNHVIRGPKFFKVDNFYEDVILRNAKGNFPFPCIVKSQVSCGVPDAHSMYDPTPPTLPETLPQTHPQTQTQSCLLFPFPKRPILGVITEFNSESSVFFHEVFCKLLDSLAKLKLTFCNSLSQGPRESRHQFRSTDSSPGPS